MKSWILEEDGFDLERITKVGNKFLTGNGYLGIRGTLPEYTKKEYCAINLAGIYDQVGDGFREPLNAPNGLYANICYQDTEYRLPQNTPEKHKIALDYRYGIFTGATDWQTPEGKLIVRTQRFASMDDKHLIAMTYNFLSECKGNISITIGIDGDVWDINGPHYDELILSKAEDLLLVTGITHEQKHQVCVCQTYDADFPVKEEIVRRDKGLYRILTLEAQAGKWYSLVIWSSVYTSKDTSDWQGQAMDTLKGARKEGYGIVLQRHKSEWDRLWRSSEITIEGDDLAQEAVNYSIYHLHCIAPRHGDHLSIPARGLSGQTYKGAVFWDTEMFLLDFFLFTEPSVARTLLQYRILTLEGAKKKAKQYGFEGAFYAWESQEGGYDACSDYNVIDVFTGRRMRTYFKDKQIHISSAIAHGIMRYTDYTGDLKLLMEGGADVILECARFYYDLLIKRVNRDRYELLDVIGPDEYHERVNNNAYTNRMAKFTFDSAIRLLCRIVELGVETEERLKEHYDLEELLHKFNEASDKLYIPEPDPSTGIIEQFDGYFSLEDVSVDEVRGRLLHEKEYWGGAYGVATHTKVIKQADVVTMLNLFSKEYDEKTLIHNWEYYEPRTEHGSSLSACMYALLACKCHMPDKAYPFFMKSALADINQNGKEWAGLLYIGGTHPAAAGGAYMTAVEGFAGLTLGKDTLTVQPSMPSGWRRMTFKVIFRGELYEADITPSHATIKPVKNDI